MARAIGARSSLLRALGPREILRREQLRRAAERSGDPSRTAESMWRAAASALAADVTRVSPRVLAVTKDGATTWIAGDQTTSLSDRASALVASDKPLALALLRDCGVPVPEHVVVPVGRRGPVDAFTGRVAPPYLVKPAGGTGGGVGVIGHLRSASDVVRALRHTWRYGDALLEAHLPRPTQRVLLLDGGIIGILQRSLPTVVGDGRRTIHGLIGAEARRRIAIGGGARGAVPLEVNEDCLFALAAAARDLRDVPEPGERIVVGSATNLVAPEEIEEVDPEFADDGVVRAARAAAQVLGVRLAGVDVVVAPDVETILVLEVNPTPGIVQHTYACAPGVVPAAAVAVLGTLLQEARKRSASSRGT